VKKKDKGNEKGTERERKYFLLLTLHSGGGESFFPLTE